MTTTMPSPKEKKTITKSPPPSTWIDIAKDICSKMYDCPKKALDTNLPRFPEDGSDGFSVDIVKREGTLVEHLATLQVYQNNFLLYQPEVDPTIDEIVESPADTLCELC